MKDPSTDDDIAIDDWLKAVTKDGPKVDEKPPSIGIQPLDENNKQEKVLKPKSEKNKYKTYNEYKESQQNEDVLIKDNGASMNRTPYIAIGIAFIMAGLLFSSLPEYEYHPFEKEEPNWINHEFKDEDLVDERNGTVYARDANIALRSLDNQWGSWGSNYDEHASSEAFKLNATSWLREIWFTFVLIGLIIPLWARREVFRIGKELE
jgi:hypothetical protein